MKWGVDTGKGVSAIVVIAHPDDETIFCAGTMLRYPDWQWEVVCLTHTAGDTRGRELACAMESFQALGVNVVAYHTLDGRDAMEELTSEEERAWGERLGACNLRADVAFTHNPTGEYGHPQHVLVNRITHELFSNVWEIVCPGAGHFQQRRRRRVNEVVLTPEILRKKRHVFDTCYPLESYLWQNLTDVMKYEFEVGPEVFTSD